MGPRVVSHRGDAREAPENTPEAFSAALRSGVIGIELDVQLTRDEIPVVYHDQTLDRAGLPGRRICELSWAELRRLEHATIPCITPTGPITTLDDVLGAFGHRTDLWIELKSRAFERAQGLPRRLAEITVEKLESRDMMRRARVLSFDRGLLRHVRTLSPDLSCCWNLEDGSDLAMAGDGVLDGLNAAGVRIEMLSEEAALRARGAGLDLYAFVVNDLAEIRLAWKRHVDVVISDVPDAVFEAIADIRERKRPHEA